MKTNKSLLTSIMIALAIGLTFGVSSVQAGLIFDYLIVGGGGAGGSTKAGGGGAGGLITSVVDVGGLITPVHSSIDAALGTFVSVTVGAGGTGASANGEDSILAYDSTTLTAFGGGGGGDYDQAGRDGGSGGGPGQNKAEGKATQPGVGGFGNDGADNSQTNYGGGGGGAGAPHPAGPAFLPNGGLGLTFDITGGDVGYAGGGGGGGLSSGSATHGGGAGGVTGSSGSAPVAGTPNTGGGGGGRGDWSDWSNYGWSTAGGGSGIVVIRYDMSQDLWGQGGIYSWYEDGGITYAVHQFTTVGDATTFTVIPEPSTIVLSGLALVGLGLRRRRRA